MRALVLSCTLKPSPAVSNTEALARVVTDVLDAEGVTTETLRVVDHEVKPGVENDMGDGDAWPAIREKVLAAEILVIASPTWLGRPSSVAQRVLERMDALLSDVDGEGRPVAYNRVAGVVVTGNEDGAHHVISEIAGALAGRGLHDPRAGVDLLEPRPGSRRQLPRQRRGQGLVPRDRPSRGVEPAGGRASAAGAAGAGAAGLAPRGRRSGPAAAGRVESIVDPPIRCLTIDSTSGSGVRGVAGAAA